MEKKRYPRKELKSEILKAGIELVKEEGITVAPANLSFKRVFERVEQSIGKSVSGSMVYERMWPDQASFQDAVISEIVRQSAIPDPATLDAIQAGVENMPRNTPEQRWEILQLLSFAAGDLNLVTSIEDWRWWVCVTVSGASLDQPESDRNVVPKEALSESVRLLADAYTLVYEWILKSIGVRAKVDGGIVLFTMAVSSIIEGLSMRVRAAPELFETKWSRELIASKTPIDVGYAGMSIWALTENMLELDPDFDPALPLPEFPDTASVFDSED